MYKVFIDQVPVLFVKFSQFLKKEDYLRINDTTYQEVKGRIQQGKKEITIVIEGDQLDEHFLSFFRGLETRVAAGGVVKNSKGEYLMIHRFGVWDFPKGHQEKGEDIQVTAYREVEEECGITGMMLGDELMTTYHTYSHKGEDVLKKCVWFSFDYDGDEKLIPQMEEDILEVKWVNADFLKNQIGRTYGSISDLIERALKVF